jgi:nucleoid DNA-binding protein
MNNKEFISKLSQRCKFTPADTASMTESIVAIISDCLKDGDQVNISGFGGFEAKMRRERISVNPKTGQRMLVPPKIVPSFRPSAKIKDKFKETE